MTDNIKKVVVIGYAGSGKSTLAEYFGKQNNLKTFHMDRMHYLPGYAIRPFEEEQELLKNFMDENNEDGWVIEGNFHSLYWDRRMEEADLIIFMNFNRLSCLNRTFKAYEDNLREAKKKDGPVYEEKWNKEFVNWLLWSGRTKKNRDYYNDVVTHYSNKSVVLKNQKELNRFKAQYNLNYL